MEIKVDLVNIPGSVADWKRALHVPVHELPTLTNDQKSFAKDFGMSDEQYARSVWARRHSEALFRRYAEQLGSFLAGLPREVDAVEIVYDGWKNKFYCNLKKRNGETIPFVIDADLVIRPLETGDDEALRNAAHRVKRAAELALDNEPERSQRTV